MKIKNLFKVWWEDYYEVTALFCCSAVSGVAAYLLSQILPYLVVALFLVGIAYLKLWSNNNMYINRIPKEDWATLFFWTLGVLLGISFLVTWS